MNRIFSKIKKAIQDPAKIILYCTKYRVFRLVPDRIYLKMVFRLSMKKKLDLKSPKTFNEKLQWLKLYDRKPEYTNMVDKEIITAKIATIVSILISSAPNFASHKRPPTHATITIKKTDMSKIVNLKVVFSGGVNPPELYFIKTLLYITMNIQ